MTDGKLNSAMGDEDQEVVFRAFAHCVHRITNKSKNLIIGLIRMSILEVTSRAQVSFIESRFLSEQQRRELIETGIDEFMSRAKLNSVHRRQIKDLCLLVYERWKKLRDERKRNEGIDYDELLDGASNLVGFEDQEVLLEAFAHYIHLAARLDKKTVMKMIRTCMLEVTIGEKVSFKESRYLDEETRQTMIERGIEEFLGQAKIGAELAPGIRKDCLKVYSRWKEIRRVNPEQDTVPLGRLVENAAGA